MEIGYETPALLFPAITLLLLAYSNRFLTLANLIRTLHAKYQETPDARIKVQLRNLRYRVILIRNMQFLAVASFFFCVVCMLFLFLQAYHPGIAQPGSKICFAVALLLLLGSLALSLREMQVSVDALSVQIADLDEGDTEH
jgi:hypothetical protein